MKKILLILLSVLVLTPAMVMGVGGDHGEIPSVQEVVTDIQSNQEVETIDDISCDQVSEDQFELLGESVMSIMQPDPETHQRMDEMMGGEGSESLRLAHINMGKNYLNCYNSATMYQNSGPMGMMGGSNYTDNFFSQNSQGAGWMHNGANPVWSIMPTLIATLVILALGLLIVFLFKKIQE